jgi:hypothetical protein
MAEGLSVGTANGVMDAVFRNQAYTPPAQIWIQLHTAAPGAAGTTAIAGNATRKQVTFGASAGGAIANSADLVWTAGEVDTSEDYTHYTLWSASSAGTFVHSGLVTANAVVTGNEFKIPAGDLDIAAVVAS